MISKEKAVGIDLEADSMYSFREKICLIQLAAGSRVFLIDPFQLKNIDPLLAVLQNKDIVKVLHGSDFDIRSLDRDYNARICSLFDTEIASRFLGTGERGLAALIKQEFNIHIEKKYQRADWSKRPFEKAMIDYSVKDAAYLIRLYEVISEKLKDKNRLSWAKEEFEIQEKVRYSADAEHPLFLKFKGAGRMDNRTLAVLENLLKMRIKHAQKLDRPLFKIIANPSILLIAEKKPVTPAQLEKTGALSSRQISMYQGSVLDAVRQAVDLKESELPSYPRHKKPVKDPARETRVKALKKLREKLSRKLGIEPGFLMNNAVIFSIAENQPGGIEQLLKIDQIRQWQVDNMGRDILSCLRNL